MIKQQAVKVFRFDHSGISLSLCCPIHEGDAGVTLLESSALDLEGEACLEFRYLSPVPEEVSQLRAIFNSSAGLREIWTSPEIDSGSWREVSVQLIVSEPGTKVGWNTVTYLLLICSRGIFSRFKEQYFQETFCCFRLCWRQFHQYGQMEKSS